MAESDDSDFQDDEVVEVVLPVQQEHGHGSTMGNKSKVPHTSDADEQVHSSVQTNKWACTSCTFLNMPRRKKCEVCDGRRK